MWVVGKIPYRRSGEEWEFIGVYDSEEKAVEACLTYEYFAAPVRINPPQREGGINWDSCQYPHRMK